MSGGKEAPDQRGVACFPTSEWDESPKPSHGLKTDRDVTGGLCPGFTRTYVIKIAGDR
jgi:hypothetical protein